jgi:hypothetical protein
MIIMAAAAMMVLMLSAMTELTVPAKKSMNPMLTLPISLVFSLTAFLMRLIIMELNNLETLN